MKTRALGWSGLVVSAIGLGTGSATTNFEARRSLHGGNHVFLVSSRRP